MTGDGDVFVAADFGVQWIRPDKGPDQKPIPLIREARGGSLSE